MKIKVTEDVEQNDLARVNISIIHQWLTLPKFDHVKDSSVRKIFRVGEYSC